MTAFPAPRRSGDGDVAADPAPGAEDLAIARGRAHEKRAWMLRAHLK